MPRARRCSHLVAVDPARRRFDHFFEELSVQAGRLAPRYALWLRMREVGLDTERLSRDDVVGFCRDHLPAFLREHRVALPPRAARALLRAIERHDPALPTPAERIARL